MRRLSSRIKSLLPPMGRRLLRDRRAATAVEYGLILAVIVLAMMVSLIGVADVTKGVWSNVSSKVTNAR
ncbi:Flp family type IVb pilin [Sphingomonas sp. NBWT7]|uniref:Flp family type IVb pilin n=1 Tax=Sphingomonas sp. NBWT7 TaxID=2596913 RepID=UPI00162739A7|nr:Flp family type IVb pilin [Sphingomonas sp. NBWT7]QNE33079.1 Flp family type IVb pilin [Sphingomonas sp. NBWT7]